MKFYEGHVHWSVSSDCYWKNERLILEPTRTKPEFFILLLEKMLISSVKKQSCFGDQNCTDAAFSIWVLHFCYFSLFFSDALKTLLWAGSWPTLTLRSKRKPAVLKLDNKRVFPPACRQPLGVWTVGVCAEVPPSPCTVKQLQGFKQLQMHPLNAPCPYLSNCHSHLGEIFTFLIKSRV